MEQKNQLVQGDFDFRKLFGTLWRGKWLVLLFAFLGGFPAWLYLRYTPSVYEASSRLKLEMSSGKKLNLIQTELNDRADEISTQAEIIQSRSMLSKLVERLNLDVSYYRQGRIIVSDIAANSSPFVVEYDSSSFRDLNKRFIVRFEDLENGYLALESEPDKEQRFQLNRPVQFGDSRLTLRRRAGFKGDYRESIYLFQVHSMANIVSQVKERLKISIPSGSIIGITYYDYVNNRAANICNALGKVYLEEEMVLKRQSYTQTISFIDTLLTRVKGKMEASEDSLEEFEQDQQVFIRSVASEEIASSYVNSKDSINKSHVNLQQLREVRQLLLSKDLENNFGDSYFPVIPSLQVFEPVATAVNNINENIWLYQQATQMVKPNIPYIQELKLRTFELREQALEYLDQVEDLYRRSIQTLKQQVDTLGEDINKEIIMRRDLEKVKRPYTLYSEIYSMLFTKRTESAIANAAITSNSRLIDRASTPYEPIRPKREAIQYGSILVGILIGIAFVFVRQTLKETITQRSDLEAVSPLPVIAEIFRLQTDPGAPTLQVFKDTKSIFTESFRVLRSSILFLLPGDGSKVITITSTISGEGKSYVAVNLAAILSALGKEVVLLDLDLRRPRLHKILNLPNKTGVSQVLVGREKVEEALQGSGFEHLDVVTSGPVPPNPAELLSGDALDRVISELDKYYEYVVIDTSPVGLVTDAIRVLKDSTVNLYIFRANYSRKSFLNFANKLKNEHQIKNMFVVFNYANQKLSRYGYRYGYGYGYNYGYGYGYAYGYTSGYYAYTSEEKPSNKWWQFWKWFS